MLRDELSSRLIFNEYPSNDAGLLMSKSLDDCRIRASNVLKDRVLCNAAPGQKENKNNNTSIFSSGHAGQRPGNIADFPSGDFKVENSCDNVSSRSFIDASCKRHAHVSPAVVLRVGNDSSRNSCDSAHNNIVVKGSAGATARKRRKCSRTLIH